MIRNWSSGRRVVHEVLSSLGEHVRCRKEIYHENFVDIYYFMFLYTFSSKTPHKIRHVSNAFIPSKNGKLDTLLAFPAGITKTKGHVVITYGDNDIRSHMLMIPNSQIKPLLRKGDMDPREFDFEILPYKTITQ